MYTTLIIGGGIGALAASKEVAKKSAIYGTTVVGGLQSIGTGLASVTGIVVQSLMSPISAELSDRWLHEIAYKGLTSYIPPRFNDEL